MRKEGSRAIRGWRAPLVFVTGTDTGVGKTTVTCLLLDWLRSGARVEACAIKPFITGSLSDARALARLQSGRFRIQQLSPFRYRPPLAPAVAAELEGRWVRMSTVLRFIETMRGACDCLLIEGCGGLLTPLGAGYSALELIEAMRPHVIVVAPNQLGVINHLRLTKSALEKAHAHSIYVVLTNKRPGTSLARRTNAGALRKLLGCEVQELPFFRGNTGQFTTIKRAVKKFEKTLAALLPSATVTALLEAAVVKATAEKKKKERLDK